MNKPTGRVPLIELDIDQTIWDRMFFVAPLVLVGTMEENGCHDLAPPHVVRVLHEPRRDDLRAVTVSPDDDLRILFLPLHVLDHRVERSGEKPPVAHVSATVDELTALY